MRPRGTEDTNVSGLRWRGKQKDTRRGQSPRAVIRRETGREVAGLRRNDVVQCPGLKQSAHSGAAAGVQARGAGVRRAWQQGRWLMVRSGRVLKMPLAHLADGLNVRHKKTRGTQEDSEGVGRPGGRR